MNKPIYSDDNVNTLFNRIMKKAKATKIHPLFLLKIVIRDAPNLSDEERQILSKLLTTKINDARKK